MIRESTWNRNVSSQTSFTWHAISEGIEFDHGQGNASYTVPWRVFHAILSHAVQMASRNDGAITAGTDQEHPTPGSLGEWVLAQDFVLTPGALTPRHLSFLGPVLGRMGFITHTHQGNSILWSLTESA